VENLALFCRVFGGCLIGLCLSAFLYPVPTQGAELLHLKNEGVNDPTIDLFLEVLDPAGESPESVKRVKAALDAGADGSMTDGHCSRNTRLIYETLFLPTR
jgi:hypothetical protein